VMLILGACFFCTSSYSGFADPVVDNQIPAPSNKSILLDLRAYCKKQYANRYYPHNFSCWSGYQNEQPVNINPDQACKDLYGDSYKSAKQYTDLYCVSP
jgi:hypothetical protein